MRAKQQSAFPLSVPVSSNNFFELDRWVMEKILLIGGCITIGGLFGALIVYALIGNKRCR